MVSEECGQAPGLKLRPRRRCGPKGQGVGIAYVWLGHRCDHWSQEGRLSVGSGKLGSARTHYQLAEVDDSRHVYWNSAQGCVRAKAQTSFHRCGVKARRRRAKIEARIRTTQVDPPRHTSTRYKHLGKSHHEIRDPVETPRLPGGLRQHRILTAHTRKPNVAQPSCPPLAFAFNHRRIAQITRYQLCDKPFQDTTTPCMPAPTPTIFATSLDPLPMPPAPIAWLPIGYTALSPCSFAARRATVLRDSVVAHLAMLAPRRSLRRAHAGAEHAAFQQHPDAPLACASRTCPDAATPTPALGSTGARTFQPASAQTKKPEATEPPAPVPAPTPM